jgi:hypothetical protein
MLSFGVFIALVLLAGVVFVISVLVAVIRTFWRLIVGPPSQAIPMSATATSAGPRCRNSGCGTVNPTQARFCRRCGSSMGATAHGPNPFESRLGSADAAII